MEKDTIFSLIGDFGRWQLKTSIILALLKFSVGWFQMNIVFLAPQQKFWCKIDNNTNLEQLKNDSEQINQCVISLNNSEKSCQDFVYDHSVFSLTIISEWNLVCSRRYLVEFTQMSFMAGTLLGYIIFGIMADKYGRRKPLIFAIIMQAISSLLSAFSPMYSIFIITRFFLAIASGGIATISFVLCTEIVGGKWRTIVPLFYQMPYAFGYIVLSGLAYFFRNWRYVQLSLSFLSLLFVSFIFSIPESPRWLLTTGQYEKTLDLFKKIAVINKKLSNYDCVPLENVVKLNENQRGDSKKPTTMILFQNRKFKLIIITLCIEWLGVGISFYSFTQYLSIVSENPFIVFTLGGLMTVPGFFICQLVLHYCSRKTTIRNFQILTAICYLLILTVPKGQYVLDWPRICFAGIGIICISVFVPTLFLYSNELFPTIARNTGMGIVLMTSKIGPILAPLVLSMEKISSYLPLIFLSLFTASLTILLTLLPETEQNVFSDNIETDRNFRTSSKSNSINF